MARKLTLVNKLAKDEDSPQPVRIDQFWSGESPSEFLCYIAVVFDNRGKLGTALSFYAAAVLLDARNDMAAKDAGRMAAAMGQWDIAVEYFEQAAFADPSQYSSLYNAAVAYSKLKNHEKAKRYSKAALVLNPIHAGAFALMLDTILTQEDYAEILRLTDEPLPAEIKNPRSTLIRVLALANVGRIAEAEALRSTISVASRRRLPELNRRIDQAIRNADLAMD